MPIDDSTVTCGLLPADLTLLEVSELSRMMCILPPSAWAMLLERWALQAVNQVFLAEEKNRIGLAKLVLAALPESLRIIQNILQKRDAVYDYELQFSLFCFISQVTNAEERAGLIQLVVQYLLNVESESAHAAWMAGDLLGDHLPPEEGVATLVTAARDAKWAAGRKGALHGLSCLVSRLEQSQPEREHIAQVLKEIAVRDTAPTVRDYAAFVLMQHGLEEEKTGI